jgi:tetratricopeptide (TPR) repeat protein
MAWENILELKPDHALAYLDAERQTNPGNPFAIYYRHYTCFLNTLISGDVPGYEAFNKESEILTGALRNSDPQHPEYLYFLSSMHMQSAFLNIYYGDQWRGIRNLYTAYRMAGQNAKNYPGFTSNLIIEGITELLISSVPDNYAWMLNWLGIRADFREAAGKLERYYAICSAEEKPEALIILSLAYGQIMLDKEKAYDLFMECDVDLKNLAITQPFMAYYASVTGHVSEAVSLLESNNGTGEIWNAQAVLLLGLAKLTMLEEDAGGYIGDFISRYKGANHIRTAYHKLSWYYFIRGDTARYVQNKQMVLSAGANFLASDQQATAEASDPAFPDVYLLKARLLFDGGMYERSLEILENIQGDDLVTEKNRLEYTYRFARVCHKLARTEMAKELYLEVISADNDHHTYFAPYSALQLGSIAETEGRYEEAEIYYKTCLEINKGQYRPGIAREAKLKLEKLKGH